MIYISFTHNLNITQLVQKDRYSKLSTEDSKKSKKIRVTSYNIDHSNIDSLDSLWFNIT